MTHAQRFPVAARAPRWRALAIPLLATALAACAPVQHARRDAAPAQTVSLIPQPATLQRLDGHFIVRDGMPLVATGDEAFAIAQRFAVLLAQTRGLHLDVRRQDAAARSGAIVFALAAAAPRAGGEERYELGVGSDGIRVTGATPHGLFDASMTLWQLLTQDSAPTTAIDVPALAIVDAPRFAWRGAMLDSARHFQPPEFVKRFIDQLAQAKLDTLHWHLSDDQGWRIEIKRYPRLTEVGAWRRPAGAAGSDANGAPVRYGGYYTQEQIRDIVRYAAERYVTIVPEIDLPGHMQAAIAAYPQLGCVEHAPAVSADWGVHSYLLNVDDATLVFVKNVIDEVADLFPGRYIHIGGDEAIKDQWKASARVQARRRALGLADEAALQAWFVARGQTFVHARGRRLIGWDEILEGGLAADATVMSWRGAKGGVEAAHAGHDVVMAPDPDLYLDHLQSVGADEPAGRPGVRSLADLYAYEPLPADLEPAAAAHVLGAQANLWTEHMRTPERVEHAAFPRLAALAEVLWSPKSARDWPGFVARMPAQLERYRMQGVAAAQSAFTVNFAAAGEPDAATLHVTLANQAGLPMRYTLDGSEPTARSRIYREPVRVADGVTVRAAAFAGERAAAPSRGQTIGPATLMSRDSSQLGQCSGTLVLRLEDDAPAHGARAFYNVDLFDPCWTWPQAPLERASRMQIRVGQLPFNFQLAGDAAHIVPRPAPQTPAGELRVHLDSCAGPLLATLPLDRAAADPAVSTLTAELPAQDRPRDLCLLFSVGGTSPMWAIERIELAH